MRYKIILALSPLLFSALAASQQPQPAWGADSSTSGDAPLAVPVTLNGQGGSLAFQSEGASESFLSGGVVFLGAYTDNALFTPTNKIGNFSYEVQPHLGWSEVTPRLKLNLGVGGGFIGNSNLNDQNQASENANADASWRITQRLTFRLDDNFGNVTGLFSSVGTPIGSEPPTVGIGPVQQQNNTLLVPGGQRVVSNETLAEFSDQLGAHTVAGVRGIYSLLDYPSLSETSQFGTLYDSRSYTAEAFYDWQFTSRQWIGVTLRGQRFETVPSIVRSDVGSLLAYYSLVASRSVTLTFFGGPEYVDTPTTSGLAALGLSGQGRFWAPSEGATLNWQGHRTSVNLSFVRQLNGGGGLATPVTLQTEGGSLRQLLSHHGSEVQFGVESSKSIPLFTQASTSQVTFNGFTAMGVFQQTFAKSFQTQAGYSWQRQDLLSGATSSVEYDRVWFSVSYNFVRPIGK
jgi:hypothetical protein